MCAPQFAPRDAALPGHRSAIGDPCIRPKGITSGLLACCSWFNQNFSENYLLEPILGGEVALPAPNVGEPFVDADDIADAAVAALTDAKHAGQLYELTGPRLLTFADAIARDFGVRAAASGAWQD